MWHVMVAKAVTVFPFRAKKKKETEKPLEWKKIIFLFLAFLLKNLQAVSLACVVLSSELTVQVFSPVISFHGEA